MSKKRLTLGRDLTALLGANIDSKENDAKVIKTSNESIESFDINKLQPGVYQPRIKIESEHLEELSESIKLHGILQPIIAREVNNGKYEILAGERRWRAAQIAGLTMVPVIVREIDNKDALAIGLIENIQREDLNSIETAKSLQRLVKEFNLTHAQAAEVLGKKRATVSNLLRLLTLDESIQDLIHTCKIEMGHARAILAAPEEHQKNIAHKVVENKLSVRTTENLVKTYDSSYEMSTLSYNIGMTDELIDLQNNLSKLMHVDMKISPKSRGLGGRITINYQHVSQLREWAMLLSKKDNESDIV